jgi:hypothetical protein
VWQSSYTFRHFSAILKEVLNKEKYSFSFFLILMWLGGSWLILPILLQNTSALILYNYSLCVWNCKNFCLLGSCKFKILSLLSASLKMTEKSGNMYEDYCVFVYYCISLLYSCWNVYRDLSSCTDHFKFIIFHSI